ncbi:MAG: hypothetical protein AAF170_04265 [Bacteroidota bacterium]
MADHLRIPPPTEPVADLVHAALEAHAGASGALALALGGENRLERGGLAKTTSEDKVAASAMARLAVRAANLPELDGYENAPPRGDHSHLNSAARVRVELRASAPGRPGAKDRIERVLRVSLALLLDLTPTDIQALASSLWSSSPPVRVAGAFARFGGFGVPRLDGKTDDWTAAAFVEIQAFTTADSLSAS